MFKSGKWQVLKLKEVFEMWTCESFKTLNWTFKNFYLMQREINLFNPEGQ